MRGKTIQTVAVAGVVFCLAVTANAAVGWHNNYWRFRKKITIDSTKVAADLTNFPVLVSIDSSGHLADHAKANGSDFVVTSSNGTTKLYREIDTFVPGTGELILWFNVPLLSSSVDSEFYLYYGNPDGTETNDYATWDENFVMVHHFQENPQSEGGEWREGIDSTRYRNHANNSGTMTSSDLLDGQIGDGWDFDGGGSDIVYIYDSDSLDCTNMTISAWLYCDENNDTILDLMSKMDAVNEPGWLIYGYGNRRWRALIHNGSGQAYKYMWWSVPSYDWLYFVWTMEVTGPSTTSGRGWVNTTKRSDAYDRIMVPTAEHIRLGYTPQYTANYQGIMDEVRISNIRRSDNWLTTSRNNQLVPTNFHSVAAYEECRNHSHKSAPDWYQNRGLYRKRVRIDHANVVADLTNFPVLLSITDAALIKKAEPDGSDIIITAGDGTNKLYREIEKYVSSNGTLVMWFNVPLLSATVDTDFYLYYGTPGLVETNDSRVWDTNYVMIHHFEEDPAEGGGKEAIDSTLYGNDGDSIGTMTLGDLVPGKIGDGWDFDGVNDYVNIVDDNSLDTKTLMVSMWVYSRASFPEDLISKQDGLYGTWMGPGWRLEGYDANENRLRIHDGTAMDRKYMSPAITGPGWRYAVLIMIEDSVNGETDTAYYLNGVRGTTTGSVPRIIPNNNMALRIGKTPNYTDEFNGVFDEVRISTSIRNMAWIKTSYRNQAYAATFCVLAEEETRAGTMFILL